MAKVLAKRELTFEDTVYFLKKGEETEIFEEVNAEGETEEVFEVDLSEFFNNTERWKNGIKNENWYMTFINAITFRVPNFLFEEHHNFLLSVIPKETKTGKRAYAIAGLVFAKDPNEALKNAFELKKLNRPYIAFEVSADYNPYLLPITKTDLKVLFNQILKELKEIKEVAIKTYEETKEVKAITSQTAQISERVLEEILSLKADTVARLNEIQLKLSLLEQKASKIDLLEERLQRLENSKVLVETNKDFSTNTKEKPKREAKEEVKSEAIEVVMVSGVVSEEGEKVGIKPFGEIGDYVEPLLDSFMRHFGITEEVEGLGERLMELVKEKFEKGESEITPEEVREVLGIETTATAPWKITIKIKKEAFKKLVKALSKTLMGIPQKEIERATKCFLQKAIEERDKEFSPEKLLECFGDKYRQKVEKFVKFAKNLKEGKGELKEGKYFALDNALVAFALELEAKRRGKKLNLYRL